MLVLAMSAWSAFKGIFFHNARMKNATFKSYNPYCGGGTWYKGQLHCQSTASDGRLSPSQVVARYANMGYNFIALTDHDTVTKIKGGSILVLGQESGKGSVESGSGHMTHMCGLDVSYAPSISMSEQERIDSITSQGGVVILNHPTAPFYSYGMDSLLTLKNYTGLEVYNALFNSMIGGASTSAWDKVLSTGKMVWGIAADDAHSPEEFGKAWVEVRIAGGITTANVLNAIKHGSFYSTQGPLISDLSFNGTTFKVSSPGADSITFFGREGRPLMMMEAEKANYNTEGGEGYVRVEISKGDLKAWSQPLFIGSRAEKGNPVSAELPEPGIHALSETMEF